MVKRGELRDHCVVVYAEEIATLPPAAQPQEHRAHLGKLSYTVHVEGGGRVIVLPKLRKFYGFIDERYPSTSDHVPRDKKGGAYFPWTDNPHEGWARLLPYLTRG